MTIYKSDINTDLLVLNWYFDMARGEDFEAAFSAELAPCGAFLEAMRRTTLIYEADEEGIWFAVWFDRIMSAGAFGLWVRKDKRTTQAALNAVREALEFGLERFPVLILATRNAHVAAQAAVLGFVVMGNIPWLFDGEAATIAWIDRVRFTAAMQRYEARDG